MIKIKKGIKMAPQKFKSLLSGRRFFGLPNLVVLVVLSLIGALVVVNTFANPASRGLGGAIVPFVDNPARGVRWKGLHLGQEGTPCHGQFEVDGQPGLCTHGPDPAPEGVDVRVKGSLLSLLGSQKVYAASVPFPCTGDGQSGRRVQILYAYPNNGVNNLNNYRSNFHTYANDVDNIFVQSARETGGPDVHMRFLHDSNCAPIINAVAVSPSSLDDNGDFYAGFIADIKAAGYNRNDREYLIFSEGNVYCGIATGWGDDSPGQTNRHNTENGFSRIDRACRNGPTAAHELGHNLGSVNKSAPNASGYAHCTDEYDLMCYKDNPNTVLTYPCSSSHDTIFDCNHNDYFSTKPPAGSYLATHWNIANSCALTFYGCSDLGIPTGLTVTHASSNSISLSWNVVNGATGYKVYRNNTLVGTVQTNGFTNTGLASSTTYSYQVVAYNSTGESSKSTAVSAKTGSSRLAAPTNLTVAGKTATSISLSWTGVSGASAYHIYGKGSNGSTYIYNWTATNFTHSGLASGVTYTYYVTAYNSTDESGWSNTVTATTAVPIPAVPTGLMVTGITHNSVSLSWNSVGGATGYKVYRNGTQVATPSTTSFNNSGLLPSTSYSFQVTAYNSAGESARSATVSVTTKPTPDTTAPSQPTNLRTTSTSTTTVNLAWNASSDNVGVTGYRISRNGKYITTVPSTTFNDAGLARWTSYTYSVSAIDAAGNVSTAATLTVRTRLF